MPFPTNIKDFFYNNVRRLIMELQLIFRSNVSYESIFRWRIYDIWPRCDTVHGGRSGGSHGSHDLHLSQDDQMYILQVWFEWRGINIIFYSSTLIYQIFLHDSSLWSFFFLFFVGGET